MRSRKSWQENPMQKSDVEIRQPQETDRPHAHVRVGAPTCPAERQLGPRSLMLTLLRMYKRWISPVLPPSCRYVPTCSEYAMEAVERYGALRGGLMATWRLLRCHPFAKGGLNPVVARTLSSRPERSGAEGPCVFPRLSLDVNHAFHSTNEMTSD
jgi:putative membrane protein insertion efficiency factor